MFCFTIHSTGDNKFSPASFDSFSSSINSNNTKFQAKCDKFRHTESSRIDFRSVLVYDVRKSVTSMADWVLNLSPDKINIAYPVYFAYIHALSLLDFHQVLYSFFGFVFEFYLCRFQDIFLYIVLFHSMIY